MNNSYKIGIPFVTFFVILGFIFDESFFILSLGCLLFFGICGVAIDICNFIESKEHREIVKEPEKKKKEVGRQYHHTADSQECVPLAWP